MRCNNIPHCQYDYRAENPTAEEPVETCAGCGAPIEGVHLRNDEGDLYCSDCMLDFIFDNFIEGGNFKEFKKAVSA